jgi:hypothetical protein
VFHVVNSWFSIDLIEEVSLLNLEVDIMSYQKILVEEHSSFLQLQVKGFGHVEPQSLLWLLYVVSKVSSKTNQALH